MTKILHLHFTYQRTLTAIQPDCVDVMKKNFVIQTRNREATAFVHPSKRRFDRTAQPFADVAPCLNHFLQFVLQRSFRRPFYKTGIEYTETPCSARHLLPFWHSFAIRLSYLASRLLPLSQKALSTAPHVQMGAAFFCSLLRARPKRGVISCRKVHEYTTKL